jgi:hypothetical protein
MTRRPGEQNPHYSHYNGLTVQPGPGPVDFAPLSRFFDHQNAITVYRPATDAATTSQCSTKRDHSSLLLDRLAEESYSIWPGNGTDLDVCYPVGSEAVERTPLTDSTLFSGDLQALIEKITDCASGIAYALKAEILLAMTHQWQGGQ